MKNFGYLIIVFLIVFGCDKHVIEKPENLIEEEKMIDILYDMAMLEAIKAQNINNLVIMGIDENNYILKKYKIDSLQFSNSNKYYASDIHNYSKMYEKIELRLTEEKNQTDTLIKKGINLNTKIATDSLSLEKAKNKKTAAKL